MTNQNEEDTEFMRETRIELDDEFQRSTLEDTKFMREARIAYLEAELASMRWPRIVRHLITGMTVVGIAASMAWCNIAQRHDDLQDQIKELKSADHRERRARVDSFNGVVIEGPSGTKYFLGRPCPTDCDGFVAGYRHGETLGLTTHRGCYEASNPESFVNGCLRWVDRSRGSSMIDPKAEMEPNHSTMGRY